MEQDVQEVLRVRIVGNPADVEHLEPSLVQVFQERGELRLLELGGDSQVALPHLQHYFHIQADVGPEAARRGDGDGRNVRQVVPVLGFFQQLLGPDRVKLVSADALVIAWEIRRKNAIGRLHQVAQNDAGDFLLVYRQVEGLAHLHVVQRRLVDIQADIVDAEAGWRSAKVRVQFVVGVAETVQVGQAHSCDVYLVVFIHQQLSSAAENEFDLFQLGSPQVVIFVAAQPEGFAHLVLGKAERPGAVWLAEPVPGVGLHVFLVQHEAGGVGQLGQKV